MKKMVTAHELVAQAGDVVAIAVPRDAAYDGMTSAERDLFEATLNHEDVSAAIEAISGGVVQNRSDGRKDEMFDDVVGAILTMPHKSRIQLSGVEIQLCIHPPMDGKPVTFSEVVVTTNDLGFTSTLEPLTINEVLEDYKVMDVFTAISVKFESFLNGKSKGNIAVFQRRADLFNAILTLVRNVK